jgi:hypothetical protein
LSQIQAALQLASLSHFVSGKSSAWYVPFREWFPTSGWLFLTGISFFLGMNYLVKHIKNFKARSSSFLDLDTLVIFQFLAACFVYIVLEFLGFNFLQFFYTANYLLPFGILALGVILSKNIPSLKYENWIIGAILFSFCIVFSLKGNAAAIGKKWDIISTISFMGCLFFSALFFQSSKEKFKILYSALSVLLVVIGFDRLTVKKNDYPYKDHSDHDLVVTLHRYIKNNIPSKNSYMFWCNVQADGLGSFFQPLSATYMNSGVLAGVFSNIFPEIYEEGFSEKTKSTIILLSSDPDAIEKAEEALKQKGYSWDIVKQEKFVLGEKQFLMLAFLLKPIETKNEN